MITALPSETLLSAEELGALWRSTADGMFFKDLAGPREVLSPRLLQILRLTPEQSSAGWNGIEARILAEDRPAYDEHVRRQFATGESFVVEVRIRRGDDQPGNFVVRGEALRDPAGKVRTVLGSVRDITPRRLAERILNERQNVAEMIALDRPLVDILTFLASSLDRHLRDCTCSIHLADTAAGTIRDGAAPGLPDEYRKMVDGIRYGPKAGACGTALHRGQIVICENLETDPLWEEFSHLALQHGLRSCWSYPIKSSGGEPLGTFAVYGRVPRRPDTAEIDLVGRAGDLAGVAILRAREQERLRQHIAQMELAEERFNLVVRASRTGVWDWNVRDRSLLLSDEWKAQLGYRPDELEASIDTWESRLHPDDAAATLEKVRRSLDDPSIPYQADFRLRHKDGGYRWIFAQGRVVLGPDGAPLRMLGAQVDVTEVKAAQAESLRQSRLLGLTQSAARIGGWELDLATGRMFWTPEAYLLHDVEPGTFRPSEEALHRFHSAEGAARLKLMLQAATSEGRSWDEEFLITTARGRRVWLRSTGQPVSDHGRVVTLFGTWQDVTESRRNQAALRQSEAVLRAVARVARLLLAADDWTGVSADALAILGEGADASRVRLFKIEEAGEPDAAFHQVGAWRATDIPCANAPEPADPSIRLHGHLARWRRLIERGSPIHGPIASLPPTEQSEPLLGGVLSVSVFPIFRDRSLWGFLMLDDCRDQRLWSAPELHALQTAAGLFSEAVSRAHELAERARIEHKLQETQKLETLGVLAGGIAHDFNNLLTSVLGNATIARMGLTDGKPVDANLQDIEHAARRAAELCQQMLAYAGKGRFFVALHDLNAIVSETSRLVLPSISRQVELAPELAPGPQFVSVDATQIRQVVLNLILNAADAIGDRPGHIILRTSIVPATLRLFDGAVSAPEQPEGRYVSLEVADNGSGMDAATLARIFDPFFTTKFTGRGLGLAAVLGIVRSHHGALFVSSRPGVGTTFRMLLPVAESNGTPMAETPTDAALPSPEPAKSPSLVLVVDDETAIRQLAAQILRRLGHDTVQAGDGEAGLAAYDDHQDRISLVMLDLSMPRMDGITALAELRKRRADLPVVLMSGYSEDDAAGRYAGMADTYFLQKPFGLQQLRDKIVAILGPRA